MNRLWCYVLGFLCGAMLTLALVMIGNLGADRAAYRQTADTLFELNRQQRATLENDGVWVHLDPNVPRLPPKE